VGEEEVTKRRRSGPKEGVEQRKGEEEEARGRTKE